MIRGGKFVAILLLTVSAMGAQAQSANSRTAKPAKTKAKSQEQMLLERLNDKFQQLEQMDEKYRRLEQNVQDLRGQLQQAKDAAAGAEKAASDARAELERSRQASGQNDQSVESLKSAVTDLKMNTASIVDTIQTNQQSIQHLESPASISFLGVKLKPGGFLAGETVVRQRGTGSDVNTPFASIPFSHQTAGVLSEFNASGRQSRISLLTEGKMSESTLRGYFEADFLSAGTTSNNNQSDSYTLRQRQAWAQAELSHGWTLTAGQMWSLATEYKNGLRNREEATPLTIDSQYNVGFSWARQYGFRVVKSLGSKFWLGTSIEESQTLNIGGHNLPTLVYQQAGNSGGANNPSANYSYNYAPDLIAKAVYQPGFGHFELFAIGRFFRDRVFPNGPAPTDASQPATTSALGAFTSKTEGGGVGANARVSLFSKRLDLGAHILAGDGVGRYSTSALADATAHPSGSLELLVGGSALGSLEYHAGKRLDLYGYYGGEYVKRAYYNTGYTVATAGATYGQPILGGYGAPTNNVSGCYTEVLPTSSSNGGGNVPGTATNCQADNRNIQEGTFGYWFRFYKGSRGTFQQGLQYSYAVRHTWQGIGNPLTNLGGSPKAIENMWFTSFRYYLPQ